MDKIFKIKTSSYKEEDFYLRTDLNEEEILKVIKPIVIAERNGGDVYDNYTLMSALESYYPKRTIEIIDDFDTILI